MALQLNGNGRSGRRTASRYKPMSEINVTPFVDVMLVLLIVFMVTAPLLTVGVPVDLPKTQAATLTDSQEPLVVTIDSPGEIFIRRRGFPWSTWRRSPSRKSAESGVRTACVVQVR